jgi:hypothetical protein
VGSTPMVFALHTMHGDQLRALLACMVTNMNQSAACRLIAAGAALGACMACPGQGDQS